MKPKLLDILECPRCHDASWKMTVHRTGERETEGEVEDAILECDRCGRTYPVVGCIPRMLPDSMQEHAGYFALEYGWSARCEIDDSLEVASFRNKHASTRESFGFEWLRYKVTGYEENARFFRRATGMTPGAVKGKRVLDAGCGMGRFLEIAASWGGEVVGVDLSLAVERAWAESAHKDRVHIIQGDIMNPPLKPQSFDLAYSIGVMHHTPDTRTAFQSTAALVRHGGRIAIWVYRSFRPEVPVGWHKRSFARCQEWASDGTRAVTVRLPHHVLHWMCYAAVPLGWLRRIADRSVLLKYTIGWPFLLLPISSHAEWRVRLCDTFDWLSPRFQWKHTSDEVRTWFREAGFECIRAEQISVSVSGRRPPADRIDDDLSGDGDRKFVAVASRPR